MTWNVYSPYIFQFLLSEPPSSFLFTKFTNTLVPFFPFIFPWISLSLLPSLLVFPSFFSLSFPFFLVPLSLSPSGFRPFISLLYPPSSHFADWCRFLPTRSVNGVSVTPPLAMTLYTACLAHLPKFCGCINPVCPSECSIHCCVLLILIFYIKNDNSTPIRVQQSPIP